MQITTEMERKYAELVIRVLNKFVSKNDSFLNLTDYKSKLIALKQLQKILDESEVISQKEFRDFAVRKLLREIYYELFGKNFGKKREVFFNVLDKYDSLEKENLSENKELEKLEKETKTNIADIFLSTMKKGEFDFPFTDQMYDLFKSPKDEENFGEYLKGFLSRIAAVLMFTYNPEYNVFSQTQKNALYNTHLHKKLNDLFVSLDYTFTDKWWTYPYSMERLIYYNEQNIKKNSSKKITTDFLELNDPAVIYFAKEFRDLEKEDEKTAQRIQDFVHQIRVDQSAAENAFCRMPYLTLMKRQGSYRDLTILTASIMKAADLDIIVLDYASHMAIAVAGNFEGTFFEHNDKKYYYCETTQTANSKEQTPWKIGQVPIDLVNNVADIIEII